MFPNLDVTTEKCYTRTMVICQMCGTENQPDAVFCSSCNSALKRINIRDTQGAKTSDVHSEGEQKESSSDNVVFRSGNQKAFSSHLKRKPGRPKTTTGSVDNLRKKFRPKKWEEMTEEEVVLRKKTHYVMILWVMIGLVALAGIARFVVYIH